MKSNRFISSLENKQDVFFKLMLVVFFVLLIVVSFYIYRNYTEGQEQKLSEAVNTMLQSEERIEAEFEKGSVVYEEELKLVAENLLELYENDTKRSNAKRALFHAGLIYFRVEDFEEARRLFDELVEGNKDFFLNPQAYILKAQSYEIEGEYEKALTSLAEFDELYPNLYFQNESKLMKARNLSYLGRYDEATELFLYFTDAAEQNVSDEKNIPAAYIQEAKESLDGFKILGINQYSYDEDKDEDKDENEENVMEIESAGDAEKAEEALIEEGEKAE